ncbi:hypothetical protein C8Q78DRAFT_285690 [Trametes maxima]|nr:hypothetical protein C8Q78DRAFT_285690 [Trametes maxima]
MKAMTQSSQASAPPTLSSGPTAIVERKLCSMAEDPRRNATIHDLPPESLAEIFMHYSKIPFEETSVSLYAQDPDEPGLTDNDTITTIEEDSVFEGFAGPTWTKIRLVCKYWDGAICTTAALWSTIVLYNPLNRHWLSLCLGRSANAALDITFLSSRFPAEGISLLGPHAGRIRTIDIAGAFEMAWVRTALQLLEREMPTLESLSVHRSYDALYADRIHVPLSSERHPQFRSLTMGHLDVPLDVGLLSRMRSLTLIECKLDLSFDHFLDALAAQGCLERVFFTGFLNQFATMEHDRMLAARKRPITLPRLASLTLFHHASLIVSSFLSCLCLPALENVQIDGLSPATSTELGGDGVLLPSLLPHPSVRSELLPILRSPWITTAWLRMDDQTSTLTAPHPMTFETRLTLSISWDILSRPTFGMKHLFVDLYDILGHAPLTEIDITGRPDNLTVDDRVRLFATYPDLETIRVAAQPFKSREDAAVPFWAALCGGALQASVIHGITTPSDATPPCPHLKYVVDVDFTRDTDGCFGALCDCLRWREERRLSRLAELVIVREYVEEDAVVQKKYRAKLEALVDSLDIYCEPRDY